MPSTLYDRQPYYRLHSVESVKIPLAACFVLALLEYLWVMDFGCNCFLYIVRSIVLSWD